MPKRKTIEQFIKESKNIHGNKYDYSLVNYKNNRTNVKIICKKHGIFEQKPCKHTLMKKEDVLYVVVLKNIQLKNL